MITASHNPPEYSGVKVVLSDGVEAPRDVEEVIEEIYADLRFRRMSWVNLGVNVQSVSDVNDFYVSGILKHIDKERIRKRGWKVVVDCANNVGSLTTPKMLRELGVKVLTVNCDLSHIPYREPEPTASSLSETSSIVRLVGADFGVAHDGDADRAVFIDRLGRVLPGDRSGVMLCEHALMNKGLRIPKKVVTAVSSSTVVEEVLNSYGVEIIWTKVGSINIARTMIRESAMLGFEENGGFLYGPHQFVRDGAMATALMLEYLAYSDTGLHEIYNKLPQMHVIKTKVSIEPSLRDSIMNSIKSRVLSEFKGDRVIDVDGVKVINPEYWFLVRPSGTEPILRIFIEARNEELANRLLNSLLNIVNEVRGR